MPIGELLYVLDVINTLMHQCAKWGCSKDVYSSPKIKEKNEKPARQVKTEG